MTTSSSNDFKMKDADEDESLGDDDYVHEDVDETAEDLMTDMKLEDEYDDIKSTQPDCDWQYCIEIYPWSVDDMSDSFVKMVKLSQFCQVTLKKLGSTSECTQELNDKLWERQRKGLLRAYLKDAMSAKSLMRTFTWKKMNLKRLTVEITKRELETSHKETAMLELDTLFLSKIRFREKAKGNLKDRSAKVSNLPGTMSAEFLTVVFARAYPVLDGKKGTRVVENPQQKLADISGFNGSMDFECSMRGSCRSFVLAHKKVLIQGQEIKIEAIDPLTMVMPEIPESGSQRKADQQTNTVINAPQPEVAKSKPGPTHPSSAPTAPPFNFRGGFAFSPSTARGAPGAYPGPIARGVNKEMSLRGYRARNMGQTMAPVIRPASGHFARPSSGMPVPMTGRQKMNEKLRRSNQVMHYAPAGGGYYPDQRTMTHRPGSVGDSFKAEIASLQNQLEQNTKDLKAKIARLQQVEQSGAFYEESQQSYDAGDWGEEEYVFDNDYVLEDYESVGDYTDGFGTNEEVPMFSYDPPDFDRPYQPPVSRPFVAVRDHGPAMSMRGQRGAGNQRAMHRGGGGSPNANRMSSGPRLMRRGARRVSANYW